MAAAEQSRDEVLAAHLRGELIICHVCLRFEFYPNLCVPLVLSRFLIVDTLDLELGALAHKGRVKDQVCKA